MVYFTRIIIATILLATSVSAFTKTVKPHQVIARTNAEAFKLGQKVLPPSTFKPTVDANGLTRSLPTKRQRAKRSQPSSGTCLNFLTVEANILVRNSNNQAIGFVSQAADGSFGVTNDASQAVFVKAGASIDGLPTVIYIVRAAGLSVIGATQSGVSTQNIAPGSPGFAKLVQSSVGGVGYDMSNTVAGPATGEASIFTFSCILGITTVTANWVNASGAGVATSFFYSINNLLGITGDYRTFQGTYSAFVKDQVILSLVAATSAGVSASR